MRRLVATAVIVGIAVVALAACRADRGSKTGPSEASEPSGPAELPVPRTEVAGATLGPWIVVVGGLTEDGAASALVHLYDRKTNAWTAAPPLPKPIHHAAVVAAGERAWVVGGYTSGNGTAWAESAAAWSLGIGDTTWREEPSLPSPRGALNAVSMPDGTIIVVGGVSGGTPVASTLVLRAGAASWEPGPDLAEAREHAAATVIDGRVFAIGGRVGSLESNKRSVESWDPAAGEPRWRAEPPLQHARGGIAASGRCVAGGEEPSGTIAPVECLRGDGSSWDVAATLERPRHGLAVVAVDRDLHVIGGGEKPGLFVSGAHEVVDVGATRSRGS